MTVEHDRAANPKMQAKDELPLYVVPVRTPERVAAFHQRQHEDRLRLALPL